MKTINRKPRIVIALLMVLVMLFSTLAVTAFASTEEVVDNGTKATGSESTVMDTNWYTFSYTPPKDGAAAKLEVLIKADASEYLNIGKADVLALAYDVYEIAVQYALDTKLGSYIDLADFEVDLLSDSSYPDLSSLPAGVKEMLKDYAKEILKVESLDELEEKLTVDVENGYTAEDVASFKEEIQNNISDLIEEVNSTAGGVATIVGTALKASGLSDEEIQEAVDSVKEIIVDPTDPANEGKSTVFTEVIEKIYGEENEDGVIVIPEDKKEAISNITETITTAADDVVNTSFSLTDVVKMFKSVSIDGVDVVSRVNGISVNYAAMLNALKKIPTPGELANYSVEDYKSLLSYSFGIDFFVIGGFDLDVVVGVDGDEYQVSKIKSVMSIVADHIDIDFTRVAYGGEVTVELKVPDEFAALLLRAAKSNMIPDSIKHKIFTCLDKNGNDIVAFVTEDLTVSDIVAVLQSIDYEKIIDASLGKDLILKLAKKFHIDDNLDNLTNEQIDNVIDKLAAKLGKYYNRAMKYVVKAAEYANEFCPKAMDKSLADFYKGNGVFSAAADATISEELLFTVINKAVSVADNHLSDAYNGKIAKVEEYLKMAIAMVMDGRTFTVTADVTVKFLDVYQVTFVNGENEVRGFLPVGADINYFANNTSVSMWMDEAGTVYTTMPAKDVTLYPVGDFTAWVEYDGNVVSNVNGVYTENGYTLTAKVEYARDNVEILYRWYKGIGDAAVLVSETTTTDKESSYTVYNVADSDAYWCEITVVDGSVVKTVKSNSVNVNITPAYINVSNYKVKWVVTYGDDNTVFENWVLGDYDLIDGKTYKITLVLDSELDSKLAWSFDEVLVLDANNTSGSLTISGEDYITILADYSDNYALEGYDTFLAYLGTFADVQWNISAHIHNWQTVPATVCTIGAPGHDEYQVCTLCGESTYNEAQHLHTWETIDDPTDGYQKHYYCAKCNIFIGKVENNESNVVDKNFGTGLVISGPNADKFTANNVTSDYEDYKFKKGQFGKGNKGTIILAYDFNPNGAEGTFTIKFEIPTDYIGSQGLYVYHITDDGSLELINHTVVNGWVVFEADDFSVYALVHVEERSNWWVWLIIALGAFLIVSGVVIAIVVSKRKKATLADDTDADASAAAAVAAPVANEGETVDTTPSVGEAAIEVSELTSAQAESPVTNDIAEDTEETEETEPVEETPVEEVVEETPAEEVVEEAPAEEVVEEAPVEEVVEETPAEEVVEEAPVEEVVEETPAEEVVEEAPVVEEPVFTDAKHADEMINDVAAERSIEVIKKSRSGKMVEVNIDDICANFEDGDVVTLETLKEKRLVNKAAGRVKILAKGIMTKCLTVEADKFSLQAVKMITLAGGTAKRYN